MSRASRSRPVSGSTPSGCSHEAPPHGPLGRLPVAGSRELPSKVYGSRPSSRRMRGAKIATMAMKISSHMATIAPRLRLRRRQASCRSDRPVSGASTFASTAAVASVLTSLCAQTSPHRPRPREEPREAEPAPSEACALRLRHGDWPVTTGYDYRRHTSPNRDLRPIPRVRPLLRTQVRARVGVPVRPSCRGLPSGGPRPRG
jgi:hypothetical protein